MSVSSDVVCALSLFTGAAVFGLEDGMSCSEWHFKCYNSLRSDCKIMQNSQRFFQHFPAINH